MTLNVDRTLADKPHMQLIHNELEELNVAFHFYQ